MKSALVPRVLLGAVAPAVVAAVTFLPRVAWGDRLPSRLATHWGLSGPPNGSMTKNGFTAFMAVFVVAVATVLVVAAMRRRFTSGTRPMMAATAAAVGGIMAGASVATLAINRDVTDWHDAGDFNLVFIAVIVAAGLLLGGLAARVAIAIDRALPFEDSGSSYQAAPTLGLARSERAVWVGSMQAHWVLALDVALVAAGIVLMLAGQVFVGILLSAAGLLTSPLASIQVRADRRGLRVAYGPLHWPVQRFAIDRIDHADAIDVKPMQWGGWGYRGSVKLFRRAAVVLRGGEGIRLTLHGGAQFAVTVDDAATGAAVINDALQSTSVDGH